MIFSVKLGWFPVSGRMDVAYDVPSRSGFLLWDVWWTPDLSFSEKVFNFKLALKHLVLPALVLGTIPLALLSRITRACMIESLSEDYVRAARSRGLTESVVLRKYALRNSLAPVVTVMGLLVGSVMTGAVLTETLFSWPGVGRWLIKSIEARDYPVIQGGILYTSFAVVMVNLLTDIVVLWLNPKTRSQVLGEAAR
jgi:dipeptide transport system permease protein